MNPDGPDSATIFAVRKNLHGAERHYRGAVARLTEATAAHELRPSARNAAAVAEARQDRARFLESVRSCQAVIERSGA